MPLKRQKKVVKVILILLISVYISSLSTGFWGGTGDSSIGYGNCACHLSVANEGNTTVEMWGSNLSILTDATVTVYVNVTSWTLTSNRIIGVFLVRSLTGDVSDIPSNDGWIILEDPNGNNNNYVEKIASAQGETVPFRWSIRAPFSAGTYSLYARVHHGGGIAYWEEDSVGLTFQVFPDVSLRPDLRLTDVFYVTQPRVGEEAIFYATIFNNHSDALEGVSVNFSINGESVSELRDQVYGAMKVRNATAVWVPSEPGIYTLRVVVDPENEIDEIGETNNEMTLVFEVLKADIHPTPGFEIVVVLLAVVLAVILQGLRRGKRNETN